MVIIGVSTVIVMYSHHIGYENMSICMNTEHGWADLNYDE